ncbi:hypothetical protein GW17_00056220, partial [Ensete ventricosum]
PSSPFAHAERPFPGSNGESVPWIWSSSIEVAQEIENEAKFQKDFISQLVISFITY